MAASAELGSILSNTRSFMEALHVGILLGIPELRDDAARWMVVAEVEQCVLGPMYLRVFEAFMDKNRESDARCAAVAQGYAKGAVGDAAMSICTPADMRICISKNEFGLQVRKGPRAAGEDANTKLWAQVHQEC